MSTPTLKTPSSDVVWRSRDGLVFVTLEHDHRYYIWCKSPEMIKYGYASGYAWSFNNAYKTPAIRRARSEASRLRPRDRSNPPHPQFP